MSPDDESVVNGLANYALKWNNHPSSIVQGFEELFHSQTHVDVTLVCAGGIIEAHKIVLSTCRLVNNFNFLQIINCL